MKAKSFLFAAGMALVLAFAFSCSNGNENPFAEQYLYCVNPIEHTCIPGPFYECSQGAAPKDICPNPAWEKAPSSSSGGRSSSGGGGDNDLLAEVYEYYYRDFNFLGFDGFKEWLKYYDPDIERCRNGVVEWECEVNGNEDGLYSPLTHACVYDGYYDGRDCDKIEPFEHCGNKLYLPHDRIRCQGGVLEGLCGDDVWMNPETHYCYWNSYTGIILASGAKEHCGSKYYIPDYVSYNHFPERCRNGVVETTCDEYGEDDIWYNPETQYCSGRNESTETYVVKAIEPCGSGYIKGSYQRCNNGVIEWLCNGDDRSDLWFNYITQRCNWRTGAVKNKVRCGS